MVKGSVGFGAEMVGGTAIFVVDDDVAAAVIVGVTE